MRRSRVRVAAVLAALCLGSVAVQAQTADELIAKNLEAKGGVDALKATTSVVMSGRISAPQGDLQMLTIAKRPNLVRRELTAAGRKTVTGFDGTTVWMQQDNGPVQEIKGSTADAAKSEAEFDSIFVDYKQKGHLIEYVGKETVNGRPVYHLRVVRKGGATQHYFVDVETGLESRISTEMAADAGQKRTVDIELSDYRTVAGRVVPFRVRQLVNGAQATQITFDSVEFNVALDDAIFRMPAAK